MERSLPDTHTGGETLHARVLAQIRADILSCRWMPNERLTLEVLRLQYKAGFSPLREALMRLGAEGLVQLTQNKGFRVAGVSGDSLFDLMQSRIDIESIALRRSIGSGGVEWEADVLAAFHRLSKQKKLTGAQGDSISSEWSKAHRAFHRSLVAACNSPIMLSIREGLFEKAERYVALAILSKLAPRNDLAEHEQIMRAALARNVSRVVELNREHIERTFKKVAKSLKKRLALSAPAVGDTSGRAELLPLAG